MLISLELNAGRETIEALNKIPEVQEAHLVYGIYDTVVRIEAKTMKELKDVIALKIRRLSKIKSTLTMIVV